MTTGEKVRALFEVMTKEEQIAAVRYIAEKDPSAAVRVKAAEVLEELTGA